MSGRRTCDHKRVFKTEKAARAELRRVRRKVVDWFRLGAYYCATHNGWHLGNTAISLGRRP